MLQGEQCRRSHFSGQRLVHWASTARGRAGTGTGDLLTQKPVHLKASEPHVLCPYAQHQPQGPHPTREDTSLHPPNSSEAEARNLRETQGSRSPMGGSFSPLYMECEEKLSIFLQFSLMKQKVCIVFPFHRVPMGRKNSLPQGSQRIKEGAPLILLPGLKQSHGKDV